MADNQVKNVRSFLESYAPNQTPDVVIKALDAISPQHRYHKRSFIAQG